MLQKMLLPYKTMEKGFPRKTKNKYLTAIIVEQIPRNISEELVLEWQFLGILSSPMEGRLNLQAKLEKERRSEYHFNDFLEVHSDSRSTFVGLLARLWPVLARLLLFLARLSLVLARLSLVLARFSLVLARFWLFLARLSLILAGVLLFLARLLPVLALLSLILAHFCVVFVALYSL